MTPSSLSRRQVLASCALAGGGGVVGATALGRSTPSPVEGSWPLGRGDPANSGVASSPGPTGPVSARWTFDEHLVARKPPVVADGRCYVGTYDDRASFVALDAATGSVDWRADLGDEGALRFPDAAAAVVDDLVVAPFGRVLLGIEREGGDVRWRRSLADGIRAPVVADGTLYVSVGDTGRVVALDPATGERAWRTSIGEWTRTGVAVAADRVLAVAGGEESGALVALDAADGERRWTNDLGAEPAGRPAVAGDTVYTTTRRDLRALSVEGEERFEFAFDVEEDAGYWHGGSSPAVADGTVYVGGPDARVHAIDAASGEREWAFWTWNTVSGDPVVAGGVVYVASDDTFVYALDADDGSRRWEFDTTGQVQGAGGAVVDGTLYVSTWDDGLYALEGT